MIALALLEVMDKEPSIASFWVSAVVLGALGFLLARRRWWWALPVLVFVALSSLGTWGEWTDPYVGPAIAQEAGRSYPWHLVASDLLTVGMVVAGMLTRRRAA